MPYFIFRNFANDQTKLCRFSRNTDEQVTAWKKLLTDAAEIFKLRSDEDVMRYIDKEKAASTKDAEIFVKRILQSLEANDGITWAIAITEKPETLIGTIGFWRLIKEHYRAEIGYMLNPQYWRKGIVQDALIPVIDWGFTELKLHSVEANINPGNAASAGLLGRNGFVREAYLEEDFFFDGTFRNTAIYFLLNKK